VYHRPYDEKKTDDDRVEASSKPLIGETVSRCLPSGSTERSITSTSAKEQANRMISSTEIPPLSGFCVFF